jgi:hypothetical protein
MVGSLRRYALSDRPSSYPGMDVSNLPAFAECPVWKDGDECEKGIRRSSRLPKNLPACTKHFDEGRFGEQISEGGYALAGFAEAVKMPRAEARRASPVYLSDAR